MNEKEIEIVDLLQEECAEVILAVSKCKRFGIDGVSIKTGVVNRAALTEEAGDLLYMVQLLIDFGLVDPHELDAARSAKYEKLRKWSTIFKED